MTSLEVEPRAMTTLLPSGASAKSKISPEVKCVIMHGRRIAAAATQKMLATLFALFKKHRKRLSSD